MFYVYFNYVQILNNDNFKKVYTYVFCWESTVADELKCVCGLSIV